MPIYCCAYSVIQILLLCPLLSLMFTDEYLPFIYHFVHPLIMTFLVARAFQLQRRSFLNCALLPHGDNSHKGYLTASLKFPFIRPKGASVTQLVSAPSRSNVPGVQVQVMLAFSLAARTKVFQQPAKSGLSNRSPHLWKWDIARLSAGKLFPKSVFGKKQTHTKHNNILIKTFDLSYVENDSIFDNALGKILKLPEQSPDI